MSFEPIAPDWPASIAHKVRAAYNRVQYLDERRRMMILGRRSEWLKGRWFGSSVGDS